MHSTSRWLFIALLGCGPATPPARNSDFRRAPLSSLHIVSKHKWKLVDGGGSDAEVYLVNTKEAYGRIALRAWDPSWPDDPNEFGAKLKEPDFFHNGVRYAITTKSFIASEWLYRGKQLPRDAGKAIPAFVMVRTVFSDEGRARFVCASMSEEGDEDDIHTELEGCRSVQVD